MAFFLYVTVTPPPSNTKFLATQCAILGDYIMLKLITDLYYYCITDIDT